MAPRLVGANIVPVFTREGVDEPNGIRMEAAEDLKDDGVHLVPSA